MTAGLYVIKRDGTKEPFDPEKIHKVLFWATEGLSNVSVSQIETRAKLQIVPGISTTDIHNIMIQSASDLISEETPNYQYVAARLKLFHVRKEVFDSFEPTPLKDLVHANVKRGVYTSEILEWYSDEELELMDSFIKHDRDMNYAYAGMVQFVEKYLVQDRVTKKIYETPQVANMMISATFFHKYPKNQRFKYVKEFYNCLSNFDFSLPTPIMSGLRMPTKQFSSCVLIETSDSLESINRVAAATVNYASKRAGIGINGGHIRAVDSKIRGGEAKHTGVTPFYRYFQSALKSCSQGGIRGASATLYAPWWHLEIETIMVLKNNKGTDDDRVRKLDYAISRNRLLFKRFQAGESITLFSPHEVPDLLDAFYKSNDEFERLYLKYEKDPKVKKKKISAKSWFEKFHTERKETGRLYYANIDHMNDHGAFRSEIKPIKQSNLCVEIALPCEELGKFKKHSAIVSIEALSDLVKKINKEGGHISDIKVTESRDFAEIDYDENLGRIQLCTLAAQNLGALKCKEDMERPLELLVRALNELLDYQDYPQVEAELATKEHRPLGIGISNLAYFVAKNGYTYNDDNFLQLWDEYMEAFQYYLIKASMLLAKERGNTCSRFSDTKYSLGIMPIDTYKKSVDELVKHEPKMDWAWLREEVKKHGMLNATLSAQMPVESSALIINATNGIEPPKELVSKKENSGAIVKQVVPGIHHLKNKYDLLWNQPSCLGYLKITAVQQKYLDQSISSNTFFNPQNYPNGEIPMQEMIKFDFLSYKWGIKTGYYCHTYDDAGDKTGDDQPQQGGACDSGACAV